MENFFGWRLLKWSYSDYVVHGGFDGASIRIVTRNVQIYFTKFFGKTMHAITIEKEMLWFYINMVSYEIDIVYLSVVAFIGHIAGRWRRRRRKRSIKPDSQSLSNDPILITNALLFMAKCWFTNSMHRWHEPMLSINVSDSTVITKWPNDRFIRFWYMWISMSI